MNITAYRYTVFLMVIFIAGCSFLKTEVFNNQINKLPELPPMSNMLIDDEESLGGNAISYQEGAGEQNIYNYDDYEDCEIVYTSDANKVKVRVSGNNKDNKKNKRAAKKSEKDQIILDAALDFCNASQEFWSEGKLEKAIATLDQAYELVLNVDTGSSPELIQQKEDLRFMISKRILEIYASRYTAVNGNHDEIPLIMNKHVEKEIKMFQGPERKFFMESYKRSGRYIDDIVKSLKEAGLPQDLAWLPLIESGFKIRALSRARALGLWQFIPSTGYKFGLKRDTWIDERLDPEKATAAAIAYMKE